MKKIVIFLLCITLILSLVSCDVSSFWSGILGTTNTTKQEYETVLLKDIIDINSVEYIVISLDCVDPASSYMPRFKHTERDTNKTVELFEIICSETLQYTNDAEYCEIFYRRKSQTLSNEWLMEQQNPLVFFYIQIMFYYENSYCPALIEIYPNNQIRIGAQNSSYYSLESHCNIWEPITLKFVTPNLEEIQQ